MRSQSDNISLLKQIFRSTLICYARSKGEIFDSMITITDTFVKKNVYFLRHEKNPKALLFAFRVIKFCEKSLCFLFESGNLALSIFPRFRRCIINTKKYKIIQKLNRIGYFANFFPIFVHIEVCWDSYGPHEALNQILK